MSERKVIKKHPVTSDNLPGIDKPFHIYSHDLMTFYPKRRYYKRVLLLRKRTLQDLSAANTVTDLQQHLQLFNLLREKLGDQLFCLLLKKICNTVHIHGTERERDVYLLIKITSLVIFWQKSSTCNEEIIWFSYYKQWWKVTKYIYATFIWYL